jgi:hypothetical protein
MRLDARCWDWLDSSRANEAREGGDVVQRQIPDLGRVLLAVGVSMVAVVIVGIESLKHRALGELNEEMNNVGQRTLKDSTAIAKSA